MSRATDLSKLTAKFQKEYGERSAMFASDIPAYDVFSSGSLALDYITGLMGFPTNRVIELAGQEGAGKSTLALHAVNNRLKFDAARGDGRGAVYIDQENRLTPDWVAAHVEDMDKVIVVKPDSMEEATDIFVEACKSESVGIVVMDSIGGAPSLRTTQKSATVGEMGGNAQAVSRFARFAEGLSGKYDVTTIGVNQIREDMEGYKRLVTPGGRAWKHACSLRVQIKPDTKDRIIDKVNGEEVQVGYKINYKVVKNSLGAPGRSAWSWFYNLENHRGFGIDRLDEIIRIAMLADVIERINQSNYEVPEIGKVNGKDNVIKVVRENPDVMAKIEQQVIAKMRSKDGVQGFSTSVDPNDDEDWGEGRMGEDGPQKAPSFGMSLADAVAKRDAEDA